MQLNQDDISEGLLLAYLRGEHLPEGEYRKVSRWLEDETNLAEARRLYQLWEISLLASPHREDIDKAFDKVKNKLEWDAADTKLVPISRTPVWWWAAASLLILGLAFVSVWYFQQEEPVVLQAQHQVREYTLLDETIISLKEDSEISYMHTEFEEGNKPRKVTLEGEAFFEVAHHKEKPFVIATHDAEVKVLGTKFLVRAYDNSPTKVLVTEGKVQVTYLTTKDVVILEAEEEVVVFKSKSPVVKASDDNQLYWKTGVMTFKEDSLGRVFKTLSQEFGTEIAVQNEDILGCKITATFKRKSLETIIQVIETTHNLHTTKEDGMIMRGLYDLYDCFE